MAVNLYPHQIDAFNELESGNILDGGTGTGKSITALAYYYIRVCNGGIKLNGHGEYSPMLSPRDLYIITTAKKRDSLEWEGELNRFNMVKGNNDFHKVNVVIDSWNNIKKYENIYGAFFIFDEQRVVGSGAWVKAFLKIAKRNKWILLSATPGDSWSDYIPVFVANGFFKNKTQFCREHVVFSRFSKYPKIERYTNEGLLLKLKSDITIHMELKKDTIPHDIKVKCSYDRDLYRKVWKERWNPYDDEPIDETSKLFYLLRKVVNSDDSRSEHILDIFNSHSKLIIFYNFTYELDRLREIFRNKGISIGEWNGEVHSEVPKDSSWVYLVQYSAGAEGWNCIETDTIVFYSQNYSYKMTKQAKGRIDRINTPYKDLYYYFLRSSAPIDIAISRALSKKKNFNERRFMYGL